MNLTKKQAELILKSNSFKPQNIEGEGMNLTKEQAKKALKLFDKLFYDEITECEEGKRILSILRNEENEKIVDFLFSALSIRITAIEDYHNFRECITYGTEILMGTMYNECCEINREIT